MIRRADWGVVGYSKIDENPVYGYIECTLLIHMLAEVPPNLLPGSSGSGLAAGVEPASNDL